MFGPAPRAPQAAANPNLPQQDEFMNQLRSQAYGQGPSLSEMEYRRRQAEMLQQQLAMGRGRSAGAARQAAYAGGQAQQGLAQGAAQAALAERLGSQQLLGNTINNASQQDYLRQQLNMQGKLAQMQMPTGFDKFMQAGTAIGAAYMGA